MSLKTLKENIEGKAKAKEQYMRNIRDMAFDIANKAGKPIKRVLDTTIGELQVNDEGIIKKTQQNKKLINDASRVINREVVAHKKRMDKALTAVGVVTTSLHKHLKEKDTVYIGRDKYTAFANLSDDTIEDAKTLQKEVIKKNAIAQVKATQYIKSSLQAGYLFNLTKQALQNKVFSNSEYINTGVNSTMFSESLNTLNAHGGSILNFYTEVGGTQQEGLRQVVNSNPMDARTKPICAAATLAGIISIKNMEKTYGVPPRMLCRCDLLYIKEEWKDIQKDVEALIAEQKEKWRDTLTTAARRKDGHFYASVEEQLNVLSKDYTPKKFEATALHSSKMRLLNKGEFDELLKNFKSSYAMRYSTPIKLHSGAAFASFTNEINDASTRIRQTGVREIDFSDVPSAKMATITADAMEDLVRAGYTPPTRILVRSPKSDAYLKRKKSVVAYFDHTNDSVIFNKQSKLAWWNSKTKNKYTKEGFLSSDNPKHTVFHEVGHVNHFKKLKRRGYQKARDLVIPKDAQPAVTARVSAYASTNAAEFVAEVFAGKMSGITYDMEIMQLYDRLKGI